LIDFIEKLSIKKCYQQTHTDEKVSSITCNYICVLCCNKRMMLLSERGFPLNENGVYLVELDSHSYNGMHSVSRYIGSSDMADNPPLKDKLNNKIGIAVRIGCCGYNPVVKFEMNESETIQG
jgi:hypothetical protein